MKKKLLCSMLLGCFMFCGIGTGMTSENYNPQKEIIIVNGEEKEIETITINNRKLIPLREVSTLLGCNVDYKDGKILINKETNLPNVNGNIKSISAVLEVKPADKGGLDWGKQIIEYYPQDNSSFTSKMTSGTGFEVPLTIINGTTYCPIRGLVENVLNYKIDFYNEKIRITEHYTTIN